MRIYYRSSDGVIQDLDRYPCWMQSGDFLNYEWEYFVTDSGNAITGLRKSVREKSFLITVFGRNEKEYKKNVDSLHEIFEKDVVRHTPGRLYFGEYYLPCYIFASEKTEWESGITSIENNFKLVEAYPYWVKETFFQFHPENGESEKKGPFPIAIGENHERKKLKSGATFLEFPFDLCRNDTKKTLYPLFDTPFELCRTKGRRIIDNPAFRESNFYMTIYGFVDNPQVIIAGHPYIVYATLYEGERLIIDSRNNTIVKIGRLGEKTNLYNARGKQYSVFKKIPSGTQSLSWSGAFGIDLRLYDERSEPKCNL